MTRINDYRYKDAHLIIQGDFHIAINEACVISGHGPSRKVTVTFSEHRWIVKDRERAKMHGEILTERLKDFHKGNLSEDVLATMASICMDHYLIGEKQGWLSRISPAFTHDCDDCVFMGAIANDEEPFLLDLYYCPSASPYPTVIARYGSAPHENKSGILFGMFNLDDDLREAYMRANGMGLINGIKLPRLNAMDHGIGSSSKSWKPRAVAAVIPDESFGTSFLVRDDDEST